MTAQELAEAKADLAAAKAALRKRVLGKDIRQTGTGGEMVAFEKATVADLRLLIADLEFSISLATGRGGALHIR